MEGFYMTICNLSNNATIRELTRYIRPSELDKFRKPLNHNNHDAIEICDTFYRDDELYDPSRDDVSTYEPYSVDDIPVCNPKKRIYNDINNWMCKADNIIERDLPPYATLIRSGKRVFLEKLLYAGHATPILNSYLDFGYTPEEVVNIFSVASSDFSTKYQLAYDAFKLIDMHYPLSLVLDYMDLSKLKNNKGDFSYNQGLLLFISEFPDARDAVVSHDRHNNEILDRTALGAFRELYEINGNTDEVKQIFKACRTYDSNDNYTVQRKLLKIAAKIYENERTWSDESSKIIAFISQLQNVYINDDIDAVREKVRLILKNIDQGINSKEIYQKILK